MDPNIEKKIDIFFLACGADADMKSFEDALTGQVHRTLREIKLYSLTVPAEQNMDDLKAILGGYELDEMTLKKRFFKMFRKLLNSAGLKDPGWNGSYPAVHNILLGVNDDEGYL